MDRHKKRSHVTFSVTHTELARLNPVLFRTTQPAQRLFGHFFEAMVGDIHNESFFLPLVEFYKIGGTTGALSVRLSEEAYSEIKRTAEVRSMSLGYIARVMCIRTVEFCEQKGTKILPEKEEIMRWLETRSAKPSSWLSNLFHLRS